MNTNLFIKRAHSPAQPRNLTTRRRSPVSPSLRIRVNTANRPLLRWLRAAELAAWVEPIPVAETDLRVFNR